MTKRVMIWLMEEEFQQLKGHADHRGIQTHELVTSMVCRALGQDIPKKPKKLRAWVQDHEVRTKAQGARSAGPGGINQTLGKTIDMLLDQGPMSTTEIRVGLQWSRSFSLAETLRDSDLVEETNRPDNRAPTRGRQPKWWKLTDKGRKLALAARNGEDD